MIFLGVMLDKSINWKDHIRTDKKFKKNMFIIPS